MKYRISLWAVVLVSACAVAAHVAHARDSAPAATVPAEAATSAASPGWKDLAGTDDKTHSLADLADAKAVIVVFTCNHCPVAKAYEDRIAQLAADLKAKGVELVAINVNNMEADKLPKMKARAEEKGYKFEYLYDPSQQVGRAFGAAVTPHVFLLDGQRKVVYAGAIDDSMNPEKVTQHYLRDAVDAVLAGNAPQTASTKPVGCGIQYE